MTAELTIIERVRDQSLSLVEQAGRADVFDPTSADEAGRLLTQVRAVIGEIDEARFAITRPLDQAKKRAMEQADAAKAPYVEAAKSLDGMILGWNIAERQRIQREQAEADAERMRLENEAQRAAEEGRLADAAELQMRRDSTGTVEKAHRAAGTQARFTWQGEVTDIADLILAVAEGKAPLNLLSVNQSALNTFARATAGKTPVPGVRFVEKAGLAAAAR